ncbi:MAG: methylmalonyl Co-A mutase-associated GTPase MeaB [Actinomycetota bacterium]
MDLDALVEGVLSGQPRAIARAVSLVEDGAVELPALSAALFPHTGSAWTVGLTGAPGVGKSSLANGLVGAGRGRGRRVSVLAVDPSSPFSGGALLGDRVRMQEHATDPEVFIRSMAARGHLGGMALAAPEAVRILDAAGAELLVVETVGVGQAELDVATATDTTIVVVQPAWGDAVQVAKAGILEIADVFVVNKADLEGAHQTVRDLEAMLRLGGRPAWMPPVLEVSSHAGDGMDSLWDTIGLHRAHLEEHDAVEPARVLRLRREVENLVAGSVRPQVERLLDEDPGLLEDLRARAVDPYGAASRLRARLP